MATGMIHGFARRIWVIPAVIAFCMLMAAVLPDVRLRLVAIAAAVTLGTIVVMTTVADAVSRFRADRRVARLAKLNACDASPCFATDHMGRIDYQNPAAEARFGRRRSVAWSLSISTSR